MVAMTTTVTLIWFQPRVVLLLVCHSLKHCCGTQCTRASLQGMRKREFRSLSLAVGQPPSGTPAAGAGSAAGGELCLQ